MNARPERGGRLLRVHRAQRHPQRVVMLSYIGAVAALTGVQLVSPALPAVQAALGLSDSQVALFTSLFLAPGIFLSVPIGLLTERFGRRIVFCLAMLLMGGGGLALLVLHDVYVLLGIRLLQGVAFAAIAPTTITLIADVLEGPAQVRAQGRRTVAQAVGEATLPLVGGALVAVAWYAPFGVQALALPLAVLGWLWLGDEGSTSRTRVRLRDIGSQMRGAVAIALQAAGLLRFLFKFAAWSYVPILLAQRGISTMEISISLSVMAIASVAAAWTAHGLVRRSSVAFLGGACLVAIGGPFVALSFTDSSSVVMLCMFLLGWSDGLYGVLQNSVMTVSVPREVRASFVAATAAVRNFGKFAAPSLIGALLLLMSLDKVFLLLGAMSLLAIPSSTPFRRIDGWLREGH